MVTVLAGATGSRLPLHEHTSRPWRIHDVAPDLQLLDVWALPTPGGPDDFPRLVDLMAGFDPAGLSSRAARLLFLLRERLGAMLRLDDPDAGIGVRVRSLRERLPADLAQAPPGPDLEPFRSVFLTQDEWAIETANRTVHGVLHLGWVPDGSAFRGQMAILVKPNGLLGAAYMTVISPFRHRIVYPSMMREIGRAWRQEQVDDAGTLTT